MVEHAAAGGGVTNSVHETGEASRYQRNLEADFELLSTPIAPGADPATAAADLERMRQQIYDKALNLASTQRRLNATIREYNSAHGFEQADRNMEKLNEVKRKGGDLGGALNRAGQAHDLTDLSFPEYSCPSAKHEGGGSSSSRTTLSPRRRATPANAPSATTHQHGQPAAARNGGNGEQGASWSASGLRRSRQGQAGRRGVLHKPRQDEGQASPSSSRKERKFTTTRSRPGAGWANRRRQPA